MSATAASSVTSFLKAKRHKGEHNGPDLLDRFLKYGCDMEIQVNVHAADGEPVEGRRSTFTDGVNTWFSYRIPKNAYDSPFFNDYKIEFPLDRYAVGIGSTGWDWKSKRSRWVGFDFDSIVGHAAGVGVTQDELDKIREAAQALPYVEARKSTGGAGLHLYVILEEEGVETLNHTEHAALARCILGVMSRDAGFSFDTNVDGCGGNMWLWHRKSSQANDGLKLIKPAETPFAAEMLPSNWTDHIDVVTRKRSKVRIAGLEVANEDPFEQLTTAHRRVPLDEKHRQVMDEIAKRGIVCAWASDHHLLQTHTHGFLRLMTDSEPCPRCNGQALDPELPEESEVKCPRCCGAGTVKVAHRIGLEGIFETNSAGRDLATPNCFAFPLDYGGWKVFRFGPGCAEAPSWEQDGKGWTTCGFNVCPSFKAAARALGGRELKKGGYEFNTLAEAVKVAEVLNPENTIEVEESLLKRKAVVHKTKEGKLAVEISREKADPENLGQWNSSDKKNSWTQVFNLSVDTTKLEVTDYDAIIRCLETIQGEPAGWAARKDDGEWTRKTSSSIKTMLQKLGHPKPEAEQIMGQAEFRPWKLVMRPFQPEYPGNRQWNLDAPQYRYQPAPRIQDGDEEGERTFHPHWDKIFNHIGQELTKYLKDLEWAKTYGIRTGADYLRAIFAAILREPFEKTPYLFLFGPENSGKSILHESFELLVTRGAVKADRALTSQSDFNGEMAGAILCIVEEKDISKTPGAHAKIKDAVTSIRLSIRRMRTDAYMVDNMTHWIQCANTQEACPVFPGDTRITMLHVPELPPGQEIAKGVLIERLKEEAPQFMRTLMDLDLPPATGRLRIPVVATQHKKRAEELNRSPLDLFIAEYLHEAPGHLIPFADFFGRFKEWLPLEEQHNWSRIKVSRSLPLKFPAGSGNQNKTFLINAAWEANLAPQSPYVIADGKIRRTD